MAATTTISVMDVLARLENVKRQGAGWTAKCPAHEDNKNSLSVGQSEDGKILLHCFAGCQIPDILASINLNVRDIMGGDNTTAGKPVIDKIYHYNDLSGKLIYQVIRFKPKDFRQRRPYGDTWAWGLSGGAYVKKYNDYYRVSKNDSPENKNIVNLPDCPKILYRLPELVKAVSEGRTIFIVEGEKDVESLINMGFHATCNTGGAGKWKADYSQFLSGANIVFIPDMDDPGIKHAMQAAWLLRDTAKRMRILYLDGIKDVSDWFKDGHTADELKTLVSKLEDYKPEKPITETEKPKTTEIKTPETTPFRILGYNDGWYYYLPGEDLQIIKLQAEQHSKTNLISLAPINWWENQFMGSRGTDWQAAVNFLFRKAKNIEIYNSRLLRGCGAWFDDGRVVQHCGDHLKVDGKKIKIDEFETKFIYNKSFSIDATDTSLITKKQASEFLNICKMPSWEKKISGTFLAGFCVVAPICGALSWRPHVWLTGASGTGKTWIMDNILKPAIGKLALHVQSNSTEAGIRQMLGINAFPVIFDEAEGEDVHARKRLQGILELIRQASSETGAPILKGGQSGHATEFRVRSCFALSSIGINITQKADASRITVLSLGRAHKKDTVDMFDELKKCVVETMTPEYCSGLRARTLSLIPVILENSMIFSRVIAEKFCDQRIGDQFGALLAGAYSLVSDNAITQEKAREWVEQQDWAEQAGLECDTDESMCLNRILEHVLTFITSTGERKEFSISEMLFSYEKHNDDYKKALERIGIKIEYKYDPDKLKNNQFIIISDSHAGIRRILSNEPWERNWGRILKRLPGAENKISARFNGAFHRATSIPFETIFSDEQETLEI